MYLWTEACDVKTNVMGKNPCSWQYSLPVLFIISSADTFLEQRYRCFSMQFLNYISTFNPDKSSNFQAKDRYRFNIPIAVSTLEMLYVNSEALIQITRTRIPYQSSTPSNTSAGRSAAGISDLSPSHYLR